MSEHYSWWTKNDDTGADHGLAPPESGENVSIAFGSTSCADLADKFSGEKKGYYYQGMGYGHPVNQKLGACFCTS